VTRVALLAVLGMAALGAGCIERAPGAGGRRQNFDRAAASRYLNPAARPEHAAHAIFGSVIELVGWDLEPERLSPGRAATLTLYWRALDEIETGWRVFVHVDGHEGQERIHGDHWPAGGTYPTDAWRKGDLVRDPVRFSLPPDFHGDAVDAWIGWYAGEERLHIANAGEVRHDGNDRLLLAVLPLAPP
jgi:hypothetical protein